MDSDDELYTRHDCLAQEEKDLGEALKKHRKAAANIVTLEIMYEHRDTGDRMVHRLRKIEKDLRKLERRIASKFQEGLEKLESENLSKLNVDSKHER